MICDVEINGRIRRAEVQRQGRGFVVAVDGRKQAADVTVLNGVWSLILSDPPGPGQHRDRRSYEIAIEERPAGELSVHVNGLHVSVGVAAGRGAWARRGYDAGGGKGPQKLLAPMPGKVVKVMVKPGDAVVDRQGVVVVEAMKMENELRAPKAGTVAEVRTAEGASVEAGAVLIVVE